MKQDGIPQKIWDAADAIADSSVELHTRAEIDDLATKIARAIMAAVEEEREAIAQIGDGLSDVYDGHAIRCAEEVEVVEARAAEAAIGGFVSIIRNRQSEDG